MIKKIGRRILGPLFSPGSFLYESYHLCRGAAAACLYQFPSKKMVVIGVTGTNGKTTTATLIATILEHAGHKVGLSSTVNFWIGGNKTVNETKMTTDNPFSLHKRLRQMQKAGTEYAVIETASHALAQHRTWGIDFDVAVFTNLTWDHLDYHKTFEAYRDAKVKLFKQTYLSHPKPGQPKIAILNLDDENMPYFDSAFPGTKFFYSAEKFDGAETKESTLTTKVTYSGPTGSKFELQTPTGSVSVNLSLPGKFNIENALAAASTCYALGVPIEKIKEGLEAAQNVAGRLEQISDEEPFRVVVDYAHNPDGFDKALSSLRSTTTGRLISVFGAAGDRDREKRPTLGQVASKYSDILLLTEEDPGSENPEKIIASIRTGIPQKFEEGQSLFIELDRKKAIRQAIEMAQPGDTIVALAMGAQTVMATKKGLIPYNEREWIRELLQSIVTNPKS